MKKFFIALLLLVLVLFGLAVALPVIFKDDIVALVKEQANDNINAKVDFGDFDLTLFKNFPNFTFTIEEVSVEGVDTFAGTHLAKVAALELVVDLKSVISGDGIDIKKVAIVKPDIHLKILEDGTANWDIAKTAEGEENELDNEGGAEGETAFKVALQLFTISEGHMIYDDASLKMRKEIHGLNHQSKGDFTQDLFVLETETQAEAVAFSYEGITYMREGSANVKANLDMDLPKMKFTFSDNVIQVNQLLLEAQGYVAMPGDDIEMDISFAAKETNFKNLLSLVPAVYSKDFESVQVDGTVGFDGYVRGVYNEELMPGFALNLTVDQGRFNYPDLPESVENINIDAHVKSAGGKDLDNTQVDVPRFHLELAKNPVDVIFSLRTPISDPAVNCVLKAQLDFGNLKNAIPLEKGDELSGEITADVSLSGKMSSIEQEKYEEFNAEGQVVVLGMNYASSSLPYGVSIVKSYANFSPQFLQLSAFEAKIGESDLKASGKIDNYLAYALKDESLHGNFTVSSNLMNLNEFMTEGAEDPATNESGAEESEGEESELSVIPVPANIDFTLNANFSKLIYDNLEISQAKGALRIYDETIALEQVSMNLLEGRATLSGTYSTKNSAAPLVNFNYLVADMDIKKAAQAFNTIEQMAPVAKSCNGKFSTDMIFNARLDEQMEPVMESLEGRGSLRTKGVTVENFKPLDQLANVLKNDKLKKQRLSDVSLTYEFREGKVFVDPFDVMLGKTKANISGSTSFQQELDYIMKMEIPRSELGGAANSVLEGLAGQASAFGLDVGLGDVIKLNALVTGTVDEPKIKTTFGGTDGKQNAADAAKEKLKDELNKKKAEAEQKAKEELEKAKQKALEEKKKLEDEAKKKAAAEKKRLEEEAKKKAEEEKKKLEDKAKDKVKDIFGK